MENSVNSEIIRRLDAMIGLLLLGLERDGRKPPLRAQISTLSGAGLRPTEIAAILGKKVGYITKELSVVRKSGRGRPDRGGV
jgi:hypothetical protein